MPGVQTFSNSQDQLIDNKGPIKSDLADVGGWRVTNQLLGKTPGERTFNLLDWWGIGYVGNSIISIWAGDSARQGVLWAPFKRMNHWFANMKPWRKRDEKFTKEEAAKLDLFLDKARDYIYEAKKGADEKPLDPYEPERPDAIKGFLKNKYGEGTEYNDAVKAIFESEPEKINGTGKTPGRQKTLYRELRRADIDKVFGAITNHDEFFALNKEHFTTPALPKIQSMEKASDKFKTLVEDTLSLKKSRQSAKLMTGFFMLSAGGWALMLPIKWLEDKKAGMVKYFDDRYERKHTLSEAEKETIQARHDELAKEPPQTYASVLSARFVSYPLIIASYLALGPKNQDSWLGKAFKSYPGTDHWSEVAATKTQGFLKKNGVTRNMTDAAERNLYRSSDSREKRYFLTDDPLHKRFAARKGGSRLHSLIQDTFTETLYSLWMVTSTFVASRVTAAVLGGSKDKGQHHLSPASASPAPLPVVPSQDQQFAPEATQLVAADPQKPTTRVSTPDALSTWMAKQKPAPERVSAPAGSEPARA